MAEGLAAKRIEQLLDEGSFVEIGGQIRARMTDFTLKDQSDASDGVITGYGQINGNPVFVYSQNREVLNGTLGEMHVAKIIRLCEMAERSDAPVIAMIDCGGFRLQESVDALDAFGRLLKKMQDMHENGMLQIAAVLGTCAGGMTMVPAMSNFAFMTKDAQVFVNAPHTIRDDQKLARIFCPADYQASCGLAEVLETESEVLEKIRELVQTIGDETYGCCEETELNRHVSVSAGKDLDVRALLDECADSRRFLELRGNYAPEMVTGFLKLNGICVGVFGNAPVQFDTDGNEIYRVDGLTAAGCKKAAEFVKNCGELNIPILTVADADGFAPLAETEKHLAVSMAELYMAYQESWVSKVTLLAGDTYGTAYTVMGSRAMGSNMVFAWKGIHIGMMEAEKACNILCADQEDQIKAQAASAYEANQNSVDTAAARGSIDAVIDPAETRKHLIMAFSML